MTVEQLIKVLSTKNPKAEVHIDIYYDMGYGLVSGDVEKIKYVKKNPDDITLVAKDGWSVR